MLRQLRSLMLPIGVVVIIPFLLNTSFKPFHIKHNFAYSAVQMPIGALLFGIGMLLLTVSIRLIIMKGKGTLAPWDLTKKMVVQGIYRYTRNPMISAVVAMLLGEAIFLGSWVLFVWFAVNVIANTIYFKLSEEPGLQKRFGKEYLEYKNNVPMWIPRTKPWNPKETFRDK